MMTLWILATLINWSLLVKIIYDTFKRTQYVNKMGCAVLLTFAAFVGPIGTFGYILIKLYDLKESYGRTDT